MHGAITSYLFEFTIIDVINNLYLLKKKNTIFNLAFDLHQHNSLHAISRVNCVCLFKSLKLRLFNLIN